MGLTIKSQPSLREELDEDVLSLEEIRDQFKDSQGRFRTQSLFWESRIDGYEPIFTTKKYDHEGCLSLYRKYMEIADPTEYQFALRIFGNWDHWKALQRAKWFQKELEEWREELKVKLESERYHEMKSLIEKNPNTQSAASATKWLAERYGEKKRGRPSKEEVKGYLARQNRAKEDLDEDAKRLGL